MRGKEAEFSFIENQNLPKSQQSQMKKSLYEKFEVVYQQNNIDKLQERL